jgi:SAM-dependent methyltransferase
MNTEKIEIAHLILGMREAFERGENAMAWARAHSSPINTTISTLIAYDLQSGTYVESARKNKQFVIQWCSQLANILRPFVSEGDKVLEVGVGEGTTLAGVVSALGIDNVSAYGFDLSWSRIAIANRWTSENNVKAKLFVADMFNIPLDDNSVDVVYTSHSLEPNRGKEEVALIELLRVARKAVVLVEPCYELATKEAKVRMDEHQYVRGLRSMAERLGVEIVDDRLLDVISNPLNPSGVLTLIKPQSLPGRENTIKWRDPLTGVPMIDKGDHFLAEQVGIAYPVLKGIPCLRAEHAIICSKI